MMQLKSPKWAELTHAYGTAEDLPSFLEQVYANPAASWDQDPWNYLCSCLYHQDDIFSASIAAVPHIIEAALPLAEKGKEISWLCVALPMWIERARWRQEPPLAADESYFLALRKVNLLITALSKRDRSDAASKTLRDAKEVLKMIGLLEGAKQTKLPDDDLFAGRNSVHE